MHRKYLLKKSASTARKTQLQPHLDLGNAPDISRFYGRIYELNTLKRSIIDDHCRLIFILGINGIGKTALSRQLIEQIKFQFHYIIYRSLYFCPTLDKLLTKLLQIFPKSANIPEDTGEKIELLLNYFREYRCLLILDDLHQLFQPEQLCGHYKTGYENYNLFFKQIAKKCHQSSLILNSQEISPEIAVLEKNNPAIRSLILSSLGSAAQEILKDNQLLDEESWNTLIENYQGNPEWLEITAVMIQDFFRGRVTEFLAIESLTLTESLKDRLNEQLQRLTELEKQVMTIIAQENDPISLGYLLNKLSFSPSELLSVIDSLKRRILLQLEQQNQETILLINALFKAMLQ